MNSTQWFFSLFFSLMISQAIAKDNEIFILQSPDFTDNSIMNVRFAGKSEANPNCVGSNDSPVLIWSNAPAKTQSFALLMFDPEGAKGLGVSHLVAYNIPGDITGFSANALRDGKGFTGGKNSSGTMVYHGPCPPVGQGAHHYIFTLIATDLTTQLPPGMDRDALLKRLKGHALAATSIIGRFGH
ncbi:hypothetical protein TUM12370_16640 [Salmonella enterica subsp. enterica serovar Choleraesuis]|nr:hypothetical protein TUM12370_16640 [Salmonella enterica subsp. enterica serovar Choleraesuis]